ncbi:MAG: hypothetical protein DMG57_05355 [Acidobacteria bacterium]|nr:MAG: hypothetical protein DMG57_05355 [Acidobacteriota bacterium]
MTDLAAAVRHEFDALDAEVPVFNIKLLEDRVNDSLSRERLVSVLAGAFGLVALLLASVGLYGVMAYLVHAERVKSASAWHWARAPRP